MTPPAACGMAACGVKDRAPPSDSAIPIDIIGTGI